MCGRYVLAEDVESYADMFAVDRVVAETLAPSYNVAPTDPVYTVAEWEEERLLGTMSWGFTPHWAEGRKIMQINARSETVATTPMFREALARRRCIIPADGFYEWEPRERGRTPHWVHLLDGAPMAFAGIYSSWKPPGGDRPIRTCAIITAPAMGAITAIHHRMPISLVPEVWDAWLDRSLTDPEEARTLLQPVGPEKMAEHPVSSRVNSVRNNFATLIQPVPDTPS